MEKHKSVYTVKDLAKISGLTPYTIRYYCKIGLFGETERNKSGVRTFSNNDILILMTIIYLKKLHMPLEDIRSFIQSSIFSTNTKKQSEELFQQHKKSLQDQIAQLNQALFYMENQIEYFKIAKNVIDSALNGSENYSGLSLTELEEEADKLLLEYINNKKAEI